MSNQVETPTDPTTAARPEALPDTWHGVRWDLAQPAGYLRWCRRWWACFNHLMLSIEEPSESERQLAHRALGPGRDGISAPDFLKRLYDDNGLAIQPSELQQVKEVGLVSAEALPWQLGALVAEMTQRGDLSRAVLVDWIGEIAVNRIYLDVVRGHYAIEGWVGGAPLEPAIAYARSPGTPSAMTDARVEPVAVVMGMTVGQLVQPRDQPSE